MSCHIFPNVKFTFWLSTVSFMSLFSFSWKTPSSRYRCSIRSEWDRCFIGIIIVMNGAFGACSCCLRLSMSKGQFKKKTKKRLQIRCVVSILWARATEPGLCDASLEASAVARQHLHAGRWQDADVAFAPIGKKETEECVFSALYGQLVVTPTCQFLGGLQSSRNQQGNAAAAALLLLQQLHHRRPPQTLHMQERRVDKDGLHLLCTHTLSKEN